MDWTPLFLSATSYTCLLTAAFPVPLSSRLDSSPTSHTSQLEKRCSSYAECKAFCTDEDPYKCVAIAFGVAIALTLIGWWWIRHRRDKSDKKDKKDIAQKTAQVDATNAAKEARKENIQTIITSVMNAKGPAA